MCKYRKLEEQLDNLTKVVKFLLSNSDIKAKIDTNIQFSGLQQSVVYYVYNNMIHSIELPVVGFLSSYSIVNITDTAIVISLSFGSPDSIKKRYYKIDMETQNMMDITDELNVINGVKKAKESKVGNK